MTATTSKLGADMLKDLEEIRSTLKNASCMSDYGDAVEMLSDLIDTLASQPAAIDNEATWAPERIWLQRGIGEEGSHTWCEHQIGEDSIGEAIEEAEYVRVDAAPLANEAGKPAAQQTLSDGAQFFACYLIDNCENEVVREESVQAWLGKMLASPRYHPAASSVEQDERGAKPVRTFTDAAMTFSPSLMAELTDSRTYARAASTSANGDRFDPYRLKVAEECCERLMSACTDAGCPDGVRMDDWIRENIRSTSANVAQGAEAVGQFQCTHYAAFAEAHKQVAAEVDALRETLGRKTAAPPEQTALTDDARDAALWRYLAQHAVIVDASVEGMVSFTVAKDADTGAAQDAAARAIDMLAAQSASGDTK